MRGAGQFAGCFVLLLLLAGPAAAKDDALLSSSQARALERAGLALARKGRVAEVESLLEVARDLRLGEKARAKIQKQLSAARKRGKAPRDARAEAKMLRQLTLTLGEGLEEADETARKHLARCIVRLDDAEPRANGILGYVEQAGRWVPAWLAKIAKRRGEVSDFVRKAQHLEVRVATGTGDHPVLSRLYERTGTWAAAHGLKIHSCTMSEARLARIVRQAVRSIALSRAILGGGFAIGIPRKQTVVLVDGSAKYVAAIAEAVSAGGLKQDDVALTGQMAAFFDSRGHLLAKWLSDSEAIEGTFYYSAIDQMVARIGGEPQACLLLGHLNWVALRMIGMPLNDATYFDEKAHRDASGPTVAKDPDSVRYERMLRIAKAGLQGSKSWLAYRTRMGAAPAWEASFLDQHGKIRGDDRIKCTIINEFLQESHLLGRLMRETRSADRRQKQAIRTALEKALGEALPAFEQRFATWLLPPEGGILQRLEPAEGTSKATSNKNLLRKLTEIRAQAVPSQTLPPLIQLDDLSRFAAMHSEYLSKHRDLWSVWPDVHEEFPDREGFTPEGNRAGQHAVIAFQIKSAEQAIDQWMGTFYHRLPLLHPGLVGVGWGLEHGIAVLDCASLVDVLSVGAYVRWPPPGAKDMPTNFVAEIPNPIPGEDQSTWGYPITFQYQGAEQQNAITMALRAGGGAQGKSVPAHFISPRAPKNEKLAPANAWALIPKAPLRSGTTYTVVLGGYKDRGQVTQLTWSFRTR